MKKLISIILSLALVACMFGMSAMAVDVLQQPVGTHGGGNINDGWTDTQFNSDKSAKADVTLTLGAVQSRYAVDITFGGTYELGVSGLVWDVNNLKYVYVAGDGTETISGNLTYNFEVANYSDQPINVTTVCTVDGKATAAGLTAAFNNDVAGNIEAAGTTASHQIVRNASGDTAEKTSTFSATIATATGTSEEWAVAINKLVEANGATTITLATFTITVAKVS